MIEKLEDVKSAINGIVKTLESRNMEMEAHYLRQAEVKLNEAISFFKKERSLDEKFIEAALSYFAAKDVPNIKNKLRLMLKIMESTNEK